MTLEGSLSLSSFLSLSLSLSLLSFCETMGCISTGIESSLLSMLIRSPFLSSSFFSLMSSFSFRWSSSGELASELVAAFSSVVKRLSLKQTTMYINQKKRQSRFFINMTIYVSEKGIRGSIGEIYALSHRCANGSAQVTTQQKLHK